MNTAAKIRLWLPEIAAYRRARLRTGSLPSPLGETDKRELEDLWTPVRHVLFGGEWDEVNSGMWDKVLGIEEYPRLDCAPYTGEFLTEGFEKSKRAWD